MRPGGCDEMPGGAGVRAAAASIDVDTHRFWKAKRHEATIAGQLFERQRKAPNGIAR